MYGAILLAAGDSRRMGSPKALLPFEGVTALELTLAAARTVAGEVAVVVGRHAPDILARVPLEGVRVVRNPDPDAGRTGSLQRGLDALPAGLVGVFVHPVDVPLVTGADFEALAEAHRATPGATAFQPTYAGRGGHPLLLDASRVDDLRVLGADTPLRALLDARPAEVCRVPVANPGVLVDVNTPEEYRAALERYGTGRARPHATRPPA